MPTCPKCHNSVSATATECPYCRMELAAYGHPGMKVLRSQTAEPLCLTCAYHEDDTCNFPKRPHAMDCMLYRDRTQPTPSVSQYSSSFQLKLWLKRNMGLIALVGLIVLSIAIALVR
ncbi:MAG: zinc-ribbon domain-containing protein [Leptolyngbyaceae cyanobacterium SL_1_1]|nr:zinc-ribbon domain-containing protein [Leptolyngbyaceae cyanobacterium SL_1_1]